MTETCPHPPERLFSWFARDDTAPDGKVLCVGCCECGTILRGEAQRFIVAATYRPLSDPMSDEPDGYAMTRQFFTDLTSAEAFYQYEVDLLDTGTVALWHGNAKLKEVQA